MSLDLAAVTKILRDGKVEVAPGLSNDEVAEVERRYGFAFSPDHRAFLQSVQPTGEGWLDWRNDSENDIRWRLAGPVDGVVFDVRNSAFWVPDWGERPMNDDDAEAIAREALGRVPTLIPIFGHRYMAAAPALAGAPVLSVVQTDIIYYGGDLLEYLAHELFGGYDVTAPDDSHRVAFWSEVVDCAFDDDGPGPRG